MKILFFIDSLTAGGKERRLVHLMNALQSISEIESCLAVMSKDIHYTDIFDLNIDIHYLLRETRKDINIFKIFYQLCKLYKPDIVHCWDSMTNTYAIPACRLLGIKLVNGMIVDTPVKQNIFNKDWLRAKITFPFSDIIVGNSNAGLRAYNAPSGKSICIYNGLDQSRFNNLKEPSLVRLDIFGNLSPDVFIVGMVAAFEARKDYKTLINSAISLLSRRKSVRFILVGGGTDLPEIKESIPISEKNKFVFLGKISGVESIINIFNIGVLLTNSKVHGEGISNSILEYMALGKPVIASRGGGTDEVITDGRNGLLIEPGNAEQLTEKIELLIEDKQLTNKLGTEGRKIVEEKFDLKIMTEKYVSLYKIIICL